MSFTFFIHTWFTQLITEIEWENSSFEFQLHPPPFAQIWVNCTKTSFQKYHFLFIFFSSLNARQSIESILDAKSFGIALFVFQMFIFGCLAGAVCWMSDVYVFLKEFPSVCVPRLHIYTNGHHFCHFGKSNLPSINEIFRYKRISLKTGLFGCWIRAGNDKTRLFRHLKWSLIWGLFS